MLRTTLSPRGVVMVMILILAKKPFLIFLKNKAFFAAEKGDILQSGTYLLGLAC